MIHAHHLGNDLERTFKIEAIARADVQAIGNGIQVLLAVLRQVRAFGQVLTNQAIDILVAATLPRAVRVTEVNRHAVFWVSSACLAISRPWS